MVLYLSIIKWNRLTVLKFKRMAPQVGLEPTTDRLTADSSTTELLRNNNGAGDENRTHNISLEG